METKVIEILGFKNLTNERQKLIYHVLANLPENASEDEIKIILDQVPEMYKPCMLLDEEEKLVTLVPEETETEEDFEDIFKRKAKTSLNFLYQKEKDLLMLNIPKTVNKNFVQKGLEALQKESEKLQEWTEKEETLEEYKTALSDLYDVDNPEDYFLKKQEIYKTFLQKVNKQVDQNLQNWKQILHQHRLTIQDIILKNQ